MADMKCLHCGTNILASTDHATDEPYMFVCNDCRDEIGNGGPTDDDGNPITEEEQERANHEQDRINKGEY